MSALIAMLWLLSVAAFATGWGVTLAASRAHKSGMRDVRLEVSLTAVCWSLSTVLAAAAAALGGSS